MKFLFIFLSLSILIQSRTLCVPGTCHANTEKASSVCTAKSSDTKPSCCSAKHSHSDDSDQDDRSCDGESCHCLGCIKVWITSPLFYFEDKELAERPYDTGEIKPDDVLDFDYIYDFYHPPRILA